MGLLKEDVAGNYAALLELSYRLTRTDTTLWEMSLQEQQMRAQQQFVLLYYLGIQAGLTSVQAYNAAGNAIRMNGASIATPGYGSVPSDYFPFNIESNYSSQYISGQGYASFSAFKQAQGSAGEGMQWHHIVEQSQIQKSGFTPESIHNTGNMIPIDTATHGKISGYYSSKQPFTNGMTVRNWLANQDFNAQYEFGLTIIKMFQNK